MHASDPDAKKYNKFCEDFPNLAIFTKSVTPGKIQLTFDHAAIGIKSLGESVVAFAVAIDLSSLFVISLKIEITFAVDGNKIRLPIAEVVLRAASGNLARSKKQRYWTPCNIVLLPPFLIDVVILHRESDVGKILWIFAHPITEWTKEGENTSKADEDNDEYSIITIEAEDTKSAKPGKAKQATAKTLATIVDNYDDLLAFLQAGAIKYARVITASLSFRADKCARIWFQCWTNGNLPTPPKPSPQDHMGLTGVLTNVATRLHTLEALRHVVAAQSKAKKDTKRWDRLPPTVQRIILAASATTGISIPASPPSTIHCFLNAMNVTALQANCFLTYAGKNIYLPTSF